MTAKKFAELISRIIVSVARVPFHVEQGKTKNIIKYVSRKTEKIKEDKNYKKFITYFIAPLKEYAIKILENSDLKLSTDTIDFYQSIINELNTKKYNVILDVVKLTITLLLNSSFIL